MIYNSYTNMPPMSVAIVKPDSTVSDWLTELGSLVSQMTEFAFDTGVTTAASAGGTQVIDATKSWGVNMWDQTHRKAVVEMVIGTTHHFADVTANAAGTLTFAAIGVAVPLGTTYAIKAGFGTVDISSISSTALTADDWTARFKALNDASVTGMFKSFGDIVAGDSFIARLGTKADGAVTDATSDSTLFGYIKGLLKDIGNVGSGDNLLTLTGLLNKKSQTMSIYNVTCVAANTEYSQALPASTKQFMVRVRGGMPDNTLSIATTTLLVPPGSGLNIIKITNDNVFTMDNVELASTTLFFSNTLAGATIEIIASV